MGTGEGEQKGGRGPYFAFEPISKAVILFIFNGGTYFHFDDVFSNYRNFLGKTLNKMREILSK